MKPIDLVVMDWGIGGLSVYTEIKRQCPNLNILYYSDAGQMPYGKMPTQKLKKRLLNLITQFAAQYDVKHFVIACNAASTVLPLIEKKLLKSGLHITGVIDRGIELVQSTTYKKIGIIGGRRTILSHCFSNQLHTSKRKVIGRIAQPLSALIESGKLNSPHMTKTLTQILKPLKKCDALILACTHYPAVSDQIQALLPNCKLLDPAVTTASYIRKNWIKQLNGLKKKRSKTLFVTSGNVSMMRKSAFAAFGIKIEKISGVFTPRS